MTRRIVRFLTRLTVSLLIASMIFGGACIAFGAAWATLAVVACAVTIAVAAALT